VAVLLSGAIFVAAALGVTHPEDSGIELVGKILSLAMVAVALFQAFVIWAGRSLAESTADRSSVPSASGRTSVPSTTARSARCAMAPSPDAVDLAPPQSTTMYRRY
jgi:hypothetical protein